ncbi:hypothetical protein AJ87_01185 [Rhizobium yanglingense]|nr:hypothetical protein AJ87_01185 [Rhizobium yanglingense]
MRRTWCAPVFQDVHYRTALEVDDNCAVPRRSSPTPVIYANDRIGEPRWAIAASRFSCCRMVVTDWHAEPVHQSLAGASTCVMAEQTDNLGDPPCPACIWGSNCRQ